MSQLVADENIINISKCSKLNKFTSLLNLMKKCKSLWNIKRYLRRFINYVYYLKLDNPAWVTPSLDIDLEIIADEYESILNLYNK